MVAARREAFLVHVDEAWDETAHLRGVRLRAPQALSDRYQRPGQFLEVEGGRMRSFFALAAAPGGPTLEILVRRGSQVADLVAALQPGVGAELRVLDILGRGFPLEEQEGRDLILVAAGSGIAPLRATVQLVLRHRERFGQVVLYYGQRQAAEFAYAREFPLWNQGGISVIPVASSRGLYVQDHLARSPPPFIGAQTAAFLCGMRGMMDAATQVLIRHGVPEDRIFENH
ncbi:MAG: oxidoreductase [Myxococcales bacterium]|nr:oxidoreductase [Myxococcota bacterium]MDW8282493.1 oxidoreductase [Myxococcales bacterium]